MDMRLRSWRPFTVAITIALTLSGVLGMRLVPAQAATPAAAPVTIDIRNFAFAPDTITITPNTTVIWTNRDTAPHDVFGVMGASALRSPTLERGAAFEYNFTLPGTYNYICSIHPDMVGKIVVQGAADGSYTFPETGFTVKGPFLAYWSSHGLDFGDYNVSYRESLALFGLPISAEFPQKLDNGKEYTVQYFERARFEAHPENADPDYQVLLGQFGRILRPADPPAPPIAGRTYFSETGHNLGGRFRDYWNGGLAVFGYPISEEIELKLEDGKTYRVQYFERARFELHPENAAPYDVLLGQFGRLILQR